MENDRQPWTRAEFEQKLREKERYYHIHHELHQLMHSGQVDKPVIQGWVANRFYYQTSIPLKDAAIMANCPDREVRRHWIQRIIDHDGTQGEEGGIEAWLQLGEAVGLTREALWSDQHLLPGVKFAVDAYVDFARRQPWEVAASSSLTELFAPTIHQSRLDAWPDHYPWIEPQGYAYFRKRLSEARRDVEHGLEIALDFYRTRAQQERMLEVLQFKLDVLWTMLDCMWMAYIAKRPPYHNVGGRP
ncbi:pyrroloquinoline-quinone synthase PqqC [Thiorhodococcus minor]|uniref:Pyrroloquinoline-quinone synthase n=1 Tax=Thiorhodococcus minor TaxID=57489 RepID=A0A6M0K7F2_9GAMM|nr:pyrroloquinoline-quinone synthase PqqC [Thiorhodococcus minor]NEV64295.1 pyrroloquinoline-quinone synthase PqqC [Thiorhodococcus minor]